MTTSAIRCPDCRARVPIGRLSCPACGALLASVSGPGARPATARGAKAGDPVVAAALAATVADDAALAAAALAAAEAAMAAHAAAQARLKDATTGTIETGAVDQAVDKAGAVVAAAVVDDPVAADELGWDVPAEPALEIEPLEVAEPRAAQGPSGLEALGLAATVEADPPVLTPRAYLAAPRGTADTWTRQTAAMQAGYRPSTLVLASATSTQANWPGVTTRGGSPAPVGAPGETADPKVKARYAPFDAARFVEIGGWFVIVGSTLAILGFLLPWSRAVIGAGGHGAYFDAWGLASPTHLIVFAGLLAILALSVIRSRIPAWVASGVVGLVSGALLIGLVWPYVIGPLGAEVGVLAVGLGGVALLLGGLIASWASRHDVTVPPV
jgi:hypothetical protein